MSKSKYSKTKAAGLLCGMSRCKSYKFRQAGAAPLFAQNRQMRRAQRKK